MNAPLLVVVGPTASGKSTLAIELARRLNGEIICADSGTIRRGATIGTAKPDRASQNKVKHHLLDIIDPNEAFSAADFKRLALVSIKDISSRHRLPIMAGGTGLYIDGLIYDYHFRPAADPILRQRLNQMNLAELQAEAKELGVDVSQIDLQNPRRIMRGIETEGSVSHKGQGIRPNTLIIGISPQKNQLADDISYRVDAMFRAGLEAEVKNLRKKYGSNCLALKAIGYREWEEYFKGQLSLEQVRLNIIRSTKELARRQMTWFKRNKSIHWIPTPVDMTEVVDLVTTSLSK